jgi:hypothetical protein
MSLRRPAVAVAAIACCAALVPPALGLAASGMPTGKYYCRYDDQSTMGIITVTGPTKYVFNKGKGGTYKLSGSKLTFTSGPMKGVYKHGKFTRKPSETYFHLFDGDSYGHVMTDATCLRSR